MTAEEIEEAILKLPPEELAKFRVWFTEFEAGMAPPIIHEETAATKLGRFAGRAIADFRKSGEGVQVDAAVTDLRLAGIEYDAKTLRIIAEADGTVKVAISALPQ